MRYSLLEPRLVELVACDVNPQAKDFGASEKDATEYEQTDWAAIVPRTFVSKGDQ